MNRYSKNLFWITFGICFGIAGSCSGDAASVLSPTELLSAPQKYLNREVEVEIVEPLGGPSTPKQLAAVKYGQVPVNIPDAPGVELYLVPAGFRPEDPNRYRKKFTEVLASPLRVKGTFLNDPDLGKSYGRQIYVIAVASTAPAIPSPVVPLASLSELQANPKKWNRKRVRYEGVYTTQFEVSALDKKIWLAFQPQTEIINPPPPKSKGGVSSHRVRVTGRLFAKPGAHYGHLGAYPFEITADRLEFLEVVGP